jgi:hypothetical protein
VDDLAGLRHTLDPDELDPLDMTHNGEVHPHIFAPQYVSPGR